MLFFEYACGLTLAMEVAQDRKVTKYEVPFFQFACGITLANYTVLFLQFVYEI